MPRDTMTTLTAETYSALCRECRDLQRDIGNATFCDDLDEADARELISMIRNCRLFLTPEPTDESATRDLGSPSFG